MVLGVFSMMGPFWAMPTALLSGTTAAAGIAFIDSVGNIGGFLGPYIIGLVAPPPDISQVDCWWW